MKSRRIFLINFATPAMRKIGLGLADRGIEVLYWEAYRFDDETFVADRQRLPHTIFHHFRDAMKDILSRGIDQGTFEPVSKKLIEDMRPYEFNALAAMSKGNFQNSSFPRHRLHYYTLLKEQHGLIQALKPDALVFSLIPNSPRGHVLYGLAQVLGVKVLMLYPVTEPPRSTLLTDYTKAPVGLREYMEAHKGESVRLEDLSADIRDDYERQRDPHVDATPEYEKRTIELRSQFSVVPGFEKIMRNLWKGTFVSVARKYVSIMTTPRRLHGPEEDISWLRYQRTIRRWRRRALESKQEYESLQRKPDLSVPYVYIALHYQPEASSNPLGDVFEEQLLMVDLIAASVPKDWVVYVKEHPMQWIPSNTYGFRYRPAGYYKKLVQLRNVTLVPTNVSTFDLVNGSRAAATLTGAPGWEAIARGKPVLIFGYPYYMNCEGVFRVNDKKTCEDALEKIKAGFIPDQQKVLQWLAAFDHTSIKAAHYRSRKFIKNPYLTEAESTMNLCDALYKASC